MKKIVTLLLLSVSLLYSYSDNDFDGVDDRIDKCLYTSFSDTVSLDGCPNNRLYFGIISFEYEYLIQNTNSIKSNTSSLYVDVDYKNYLFSYSKSYYTIDKKDYKGDDFFSFGYKTYYTNILNKSYIGIKKANKSSDISIKENEYFFNTNINYSFNTDINFGLFYQYNIINNNSSSNYLNYQNYSFSSSYNTKNISYFIDYINSGSINKSTNEYKSIKLSSIYNINKNIYLKLSYDKSLLNSDNDMAISLGYTYD